MPNERGAIVLTTGGTITTQVAADGSLTASLPGPELVGRAGAPRVEVRELLRTGSYLLDVDDMHHVALTAVTAAQCGAGVVVTHGTDTLEESAFLTDLLYDCDAPIVFCGAQRQADHPDPDGPANLRDSIMVAADSRARARGLGVLVCLERRVDAAREATKVDTHALRPFAARQGGPVAELGAAGLSVYRRPRRVGFSPQLAASKAAWRW